MDKNAIKKYAVWARRELIDRVTKRAAVYGITAGNSEDYNAESVNGHLLSGTEKRQRQALIRRIEEKGYEQVIEEAAYTWFNRFAALRFMEVNGYLPSHIRVFTDDAGRFKPQILSEAIHLELDGLNMEKVYHLKDTNQEEELFKYLLIVQCSALNRILPGMFQEIEDYTELLLPDYLLREGSVIEQMVILIPEADWKDQVQIIGWLYEAYNTELNEIVYDGNMAKGRIAKNLLPAATTIYTPDWPVHYMVENSLGRLWIEGHPNDELKAKWKYFLEEAEQEPGARIQLTEVRKQYAGLKPEEILVIDPCAGSGHILCVLFDMLVQIYEDYGYTAREAAVSIVQNNLWGLDIDDRAAQLAYFAVMMKARQYDRRFFTRGAQPHIYAVQESNIVNRDHLNYLGHGLSVIERNNALNQAYSLLDEFIDAKEYGSILQPSEYDWPLLLRFVGDSTTNQQMSFGEVGLDTTQVQMRQLIAQAQALAQKYHVVVTNPPYLNAARFSEKLTEYVRIHYPEEKADLSMVMYRKAIDSFAKKNGFVSFITTSSWLFLSSFEELREESFRQVTFASIVDFGTELFEGKVGHNPITSWVARNVYIPDYTHIAIRLVDFCYARRDEKEAEFYSETNRHFAKQDNYSMIPGSPVAYWLDDRFIRHYSNNVPLLGTEASPCAGLATGDNDIFQRYWFEVSLDRIAFGCMSVEETQTRPERWYPCNSGGEFRKWYPADMILVDWYQDGKKLKSYRNKAGKLAARPQNTQWYFKEGFTWNKLSSSRFAVRYKRAGFIFDDTSRSAFPHKKELLKYYIGLLCSNVIFAYLRALNPTMSFTNGDLVRLPMYVVNDKIDIVNQCVDTSIKCSKDDWDSQEISWDFQQNPLVPPSFSQQYMRLVDCWNNWEHTCNERFSLLKDKEEELNRIFIDIYGLQEELSPDVDDRDVTVRKAELGRDIRSLISYAVGCMLGRYSLDKPGLAFAGGTWDNSKNATYQADNDGILPITDDEYFYDDIVVMFVDWVKTVYGADTLEENLRFIADAIGGKGSPREIIRNYFLNDFYKDHLKTYQKRPVYWLFDSGKKNSFKALIYMHRYQPDTIARIRTDYVHEMQSRYRTAIYDIEQRMNGASTSERVKLTKRLTILQAQAEELRLYEEKVHHLADQMITIDPDDGVKMNYAKFADVLAPIK